MAYVSQYMGTRQVGPLLVAEDAVGSDLASSVAVSGDGRVMVVGAPDWEGSVSNCGGVYTYDRINEAWVPRGRDSAGVAIDSMGILVAPSPVSSLRFGKAVALNEDGTVLAVSSTAYSSGIGGVWIYDWNAGTNTWTLRGSPLTGTVNSAFGYSIALSKDGKVLAIGNRDYDYNGFFNNGAVFTYDWDGAAWVARPILYSPTGSNTNFGIACTLNGDGTRMVVSQSGTTSSGGTGIISTYDWNAEFGLWVLVKAYQAGPDSAASDEFGYSLSISADGKRLAVGAHSWEGAQTNQGAVYLMLWNDTTDQWDTDPTNYITWFTTTATNEQLGSGVSITSDGGLVVACADFADPNTLQFNVGAVYTLQAFTYKVSGIVYDNTGAPAVGRQLFIQKRSTGEYAGGGVSAGDGTFSIGVSTNEEVGVVVLDDASGTQYNALIFDLVKPV